MTSALLYVLLAFASASLIAATVLGQRLNLAAHKLRRKPGQLAGPSDFGDQSSELELENKLDVVRAPEAPAHLKQTLRLYRAAQIASVVFLLAAFITSKAA